MSLRDRLKEKSTLTELVEVGGESFELRGMTKRARGALFAKSRRKDGSVDGDKLEALLLSACVCDPESHQPVYGEAEAREWDSVSSHITGPLMTGVMRVCGMDKTDLGPKDSDTIES